MKNPLDFLLQFLQTFEEGRIFLPAGSHVHKIHTRGTPESLWFSEASAGQLPVCHGNVNMYGFTLFDDGFVLYAEVKTDSVEIAWQAIFKQEA